MNRTMKAVMKIAAHIVLGILLPLAAQAQVSVSLSPVPHMQFLNNAGQPLANGCVFTYQGGTTTPAATYVDSTGTGQNTNPIILNAGGFADIWLPNAAFKFKVVSAGGVNCASGVTQWTVDNISGVLGLLNLANVWTASNTFQQPVIITPNANQLVLGAGGNQTTLNFPAPAGNIVINTPSIAGTLARTSGDTFTNTTLTNPILSVAQTYTNGVVGTGLNLLAALSQTGTNQVGTVQLPITTDAIGVCVANCSTSGQATLVTYGQVGCIFDNASSGGDYVTISTTVAGNCHDFGGSYPTGVGVQVIGRIVTGNSIPAGLNTIVFWGAEVKTQSTIVAVANLTAQAANISSTPMFTPTANGLYRLTCYTVVTQVATTSSTLPTCNVLYTDADSSVAQTITVTQASSSNVLGQVGGSGSPGSDGFSFFAKSSVAISYQTATYASVGATPMQYAIHVRLEGPL